MNQPDFIQIPIVVLTDERLNALDKVLFGYIYWLTKLKLEKCIASNRTLADLAMTSPNTVQHCLTRLEKCNYITRVFHVAEMGIEELHTTQRNTRLEILCNVQYRHTHYPQVMGVLPTGNGGVLPTGNHNKKSPIKKKIKEERALPAKVRKALDDFIQHRREIKSPLTPLALERLEIRLEKIPEAMAVAMLDQSIENGWKGIFELKADNKKGGSVDLSHIQ